MEGVFLGCKNFNSYINNWDVSKVKNMAKMFQGCENFNQALDKWNTSNLVNTHKMFQGCKNLIKILILGIHLI
ncbi:TPA: BspA family leucine-rich repeat surface protein [Campylobacter lari]|nr:BspA family leucine-rich repeat surface protein [Campylobacter lari]